MKASFLLLTLAGGAAAVAGPSWSVSRNPGPAGSCDRTHPSRSSEYVSIWVNEPQPMYPDHGSTWGVWPVGNHAPPREYNGTIMFPHNPDMGDDIRIGVPGYDTPCIITQSTAAAGSMVKCVVQSRLSSDVFEVQGTEIPVHMKATKPFPGVTATVDMGNLGSQTVSLTFDGGCNLMYAAPTVTASPMISSRGVMPSMLEYCGEAAEMILPLIASQGGNSGIHPTPVEIDGKLKIVFNAPANWRSTDLITVKKAGRQGMVDCMPIPPTAGAMPQMSCDVTSLFQDATGAIRLPQVTEFPAVLHMRWVGARAPWSGLVVEFMNYPPSLPAGAAPVNLGMAYGEMACKWPASACRTPPPMMKYMNNCSAALEGAKCAATGCTGGTTGAPVNIWYTCKAARWVGAPRGCEVVNAPIAQTVPACPARSFSGYVESCAAAYDGASCAITSCASDYSPDGSVTAVGGNLMCKDSYWIGEPKGCAVGLPPVTCGELARPAYEHTCVGDAQHGQHCRPTGCSAGHVLAAGVTAATGDLVCRNGEWYGAEFEGCVEDVGMVPTFGTCGALSAPTDLPVGYTTTNCTGVSYDTYSTCEVVCDEGAGYSGTAVGSSMCFDGKWYAQYGGCEKKCRLPESICDHATGKLLNGVRVRGLFGEQSVDGGCWLDSRGKFSLWRASCARGYDLSSTSAPASQSATFCLGGSLIGGFAKYNAPTCVAEGTEVKKECKCGDPGKHSLTTQAVSGLFRTGASVPGKNEWRCDRIQNFVTCRCEC